MNNYQSVSARLDCSTNIYEVKQRLQNKKQSGLRQEDDKMQ